MGTTPLPTPTAPPFGTFPAMPTVRATRRVHFSAAHRLHRPEWSDARNTEVFGECANPLWHGHNYELDVTVEGPVVEEELVAQPRAAARLHGDPQREVVASLAVQKRPDLRRGALGEEDAVGHRGLGGGGLSRHVAAFRLVVPAVAPRAGPAGMVRDFVADVNPVASRRIPRSSHGPRWRARPRRAEVVPRMGD